MKIRTGHSCSYYTHLHSTLVPCSHITSLSIYRLPQGNVTLFCPALFCFIVNLCGVILVDVVGGSRFGIRTYMHGYMV